MAQHGAAYKLLVINRAATAGGRTLTSLQLQRRNDLRCLDCEPVRQ